MEKLAVSPHIEELRYCLNKFYPEDTRREYIMDIVFRIENTIEHEIRDNYQRAADNFIRNIEKHKN